MSNNRSGNKTPDLALTADTWGTREEIQALGSRIRTMLPGGDSLPPEAAWALAQYARLTGANPFRGEIYAWVDKRGKLILAEGYKLLVRWAKRQCPYSEKYDPLPDLPEGYIGYRCFILRNDALPLLKTLIEAGVNYQEAFGVAATSAIGIIRKDEMWSNKYNKPIDPPKGWDWEQVARKRALKTALNFSHGAPSLQEIARESWMIGDTETEPEDWLEVIPDTLPEERERTALLSAQVRQRLAELEQLTDEELAALLDSNREILRGSDDDEELL